MNLFLIHSDFATNLPVDGFTPLMCRIMVSKTLTRNCQIRGKPATFPPCRRPVTPGADAAYST